MAAAYLPSSAWDAVTTQVPAATTVNEVPSIEQTPDEFVLKVTGAVPRPLVALNVCGLLSVVMLVGLKRVMVWATLVTVMVFMALVEAYLSSSAWDAVTTQVPAATTVNEVPSIEQTPDEFVLKVTGAEPRPLVALNVCGLLRAVILAGLKRVMVCAALVIIIDLFMLAGA